MQVLPKVQKERIQVANFLMHSAVKETGQPLKRFPDFHTRQIRTTNCDL